jgi:hypothetical protein
MAIDPPPSASSRGEVQRRGGSPKMRPGMTTRPSASPRTSITASPVARSASRQRGLAEMAVAWSVVSDPSDGSGGAWSVVSDPSDGSGGACRW